MDETRTLSPLDGRYRRQTEALSEYLSEDALNRLRIYVEVEWLIFLSDQRLISGPSPLTEKEVAALRKVATDYTLSARDLLAQFEAETRHDVKAVEYLIRDVAQREGASRWVEAVHLFATSDDINNLAIALGVKGALQNVWVPAARKLLDRLRHLSSALADTPMLARTHGQSATPTTMGKELAVFLWRLDDTLARVEHAEYRGKFNGATGTFAAHVVGAPDVDWMEASRTFVTSLGLTWNPLTTQIESHDWQCRLYDEITHFNRICHNLATDLWTYISLGYFRQNLAAQGSTGSSTMPHKVNPIRFENAEANLEMSDAVLQVLSAKLSTSRLQRDLSDSSLQRNIGVGLGYSLVALDNLVRGLGGLEIDERHLDTELEQHWEVLSEAVQQAMRVATLRPGSFSPAESSEENTAVSPGPYELLKDLTRGRHVKQEDLAAAIAAADLPSDLRQSLTDLTPQSYVGLAAKLAALVTAQP